MLPKCHGSTMVHVQNTNILKRIPQYYPNKKVIWWYHGIVIVSDDNTMVYGAEIHGSSWYFHGTTILHYYTTLQNTMVVP